MKERIRLFFDGERKECANGHIAPVSDFYAHGNNRTSPDMSAYYRPYCKKCHNQINIRKQLEVRQAKFPGSFWDCANCDHIVAIKRDTCEKCGVVKGSLSLPKVSKYESESWTC